MAKGHYRHEVPIDLEAPLPLQPLGRGPLLAEPRRPAHVQGCGCLECWNEGLRYGEWLKQKKLNEL